MRDEPETAPSSAAFDRPDPQADAELERYVRRSVVRTVAALVVLFAGFGVLGLAYEAELAALTRSVHHAVGLWGLYAILFLSDAVVSPVPPDAILAVIAHSELSRSWPLAVLGLGAVSCAGGSLGWFFGSALKRTRAAETLLGRFRRNRRLVARYGLLAVAFGALTPIPFSLTCWTAGMLGLRFPSFFLVSLLRFPRFFLYYWVIADAGTLWRALF